MSTVADDTNTGQFSPDSGVFGDLLNNLATLGTSAGSVIGAIKGDTGKPTAAQQAAANAQTTSATIKVLYVVGGLVVVVLAGFLIVPRMLARGK